MIVSFQNQGTEDVFNGEDSSAANKVCPQAIWSVAQRKLDQLDSVIRLDELRIPPGNRLKALKGGLKGRYSLRINDQFRICFVWTHTGPADVEIVDYH